jgi:hypothetical protein
MQYRPVAICMIIFQRFYQLDRSVNLCSRTLAVRRHLCQVFGEIADASINQH